MIKKLLIFICVALGLPSVALAHTNVKITKRPSKRRQQLSQTKQAALCIGTLTVAAALPTTVLFWLYRRHFGPEGQQGTSAQIELQQQSTVTVAITPMPSGPKPNVTTSQGVDSGLQQALDASLQTANLDEWLKLHPTALGFPLEGPVQHQIKIDERTVEVQKIASPNQGEETLTCGYWALLNAQNIAIGNTNIERSTVPSEWQRRVVDQLEGVANNIGWESLAEAMNTPVSKLKNGENLDRDQLQFTAVEASVPFGEISFVLWDDQQKRWEAHERLQGQPVYGERVFNPFKNVGLHKVCLEVGGHWVAVVIDRRDNATVTYRWANSLTSNWYPVLGRFINGIEGDKVVPDTV